MLHTIFTRRKRENVKMSINSGCAKIFPQYNKISKNGNRREQMPVILYNYITAEKCKIFKKWE